jgi:hypothetical protein
MKKTAQEAVGNLDKFEQEQKRSNRVNKTTALEK